MTNYPLRRLTTAAMFIALGLLLPFITGQIPQIGKMLLPMHIPVMLCGLICGWKYGLAVGFIVPLLRGVLFSTPVFYPTGLGMAFELAAYGAVIGFLYNRSRWKCVIALYRSLFVSMIAGRIVWAASRVILLGLAGDRFTFEMFLAGGFINAFPGIILQLIAIPSVMVALDRTKLVPFGRNENIRFDAE